MTSGNDSKERLATNEPFHATPPARQRVADQVFAALARAIFKRELKPGEPLPTQRELAKRFHISPLVVRQAIHRLEDVGLVRVRQGSVTMVLDPDSSSDIRLVQLRMEVSEPGETLAIDALEVQLLFVVPLLHLAERRITSEQLAVLRYIVDTAEHSATTEDALRSFRAQYWRQIAAITQNSLFLQQVRWWSSLIRELNHLKRYQMPASQVQFDFYRRLNDALERGEGTVSVYLDAIRPLLDSFERHRAAHDSRQTESASRTASARER